MAEHTTKPKGTFAKLMASSPLQEEKKPADPHVSQRTRPSPPVSPHLLTEQSEQDTINSPVASKLAGKQDRLQASKHASMLALSQDTLESIRKIVKNPGKEDVLYVRLSKEEKDKLADVSYTYKRQGMRTSDNEVVRVAINALLEDYKINGVNSLLAVLLASLHA
jgi:hypothetical protein